MLAASDAMEHLALAFMANLPAVIIAVATLLTAMRNNKAVGRVHNCLHKHMRKVHGRLRRVCRGEHCDSSGCWTAPNKKPARRRRKSKNSDDGTG